VPRTSVSLEGALKILALLQQLKTQRPDLKPVPLLSLINLVVVGDHARRATKRRTSRTRGELTAGLRALQGPPRTRERLMVAGLETALRVPPFPSEPEDAIERIQAEGLRIDQVVPRPVPTPIPELFARDGRRPSDGDAVFRDIGKISASERACIVAAPFAIQAVRAPVAGIGGTILRGAALAILAGCGIELITED